MSQESHELSLVGNFQKYSEPWEHYELQPFTEEELQFLLDFHYKVLPEYDPNRLTQPKRFTWEARRKTEALRGPLDNGLGSFLKDFNSKEFSEESPVPLIVEKLQLFLEQASITVPENAQVRVVFDLQLPEFSYRIHSDVKRKFSTWMIYLTGNQGTFLHTGINDQTPVKQIDGSLGSTMFFKRTEQSWHSMHTIGMSETRRSINVIIT